MPPSRSSSAVAAAFNADAFRARGRGPSHGWLLRTTLIKPLTREEDLRELVIAIRSATREPAPS
jgi:hypothetical protein